MRRQAVVEDGRTGWTGHRWRSAATVAAAVAVASVALSACGLHVSKNGISGNILGHKFSASQHQLPAGFPSDIPTPDNSQVLVGGGASDSSGAGWDVAFAVTGDVTSGSTAYQAKFRNAGYTISQVQSSGPTAVTSPTTAGSSAGSGNTSTTVTVDGASFVATSPNWQVTVLLGSSSSAVGSELKAGQYGVNITAVPPPSTTTTTG
jgi:hypothetical protein